jgi:hypothetical protein
MKPLVYAMLFVSLVPIQSVVLPHLSVWGVKPDLGLIVVCLVGLLTSEFEGLVAGLVVGWIMSLFSAESLILSMIVKGTVGYAAGLAGRQVVYLTPAALMLGLLAVSTVAGLLMASSLTLHDQQDLWWAIRTVVLPQAVFDAAFGGAVYWAVGKRLNVERLLSAYRA